MKQNLLNVLDVTCLDPQATSAQIQKLAQQTQQYHCAALCIRPDKLSDVDPNLGITCATVVNFPEGHDDFTTILETIDQARQHPLLKEVDYVFPYVDYLKGATTTALQMTQRILTHCHQHHLHVKVILETGALPSTEIIFKIAQALIEQGCDFLKTSTGYHPIGATLSATEALLKAIHASSHPCGLKVSGGIKTLDDATQFVEQAECTLEKPIAANWFRLGSSRLLDILSA